MYSRCSMKNWGKQIQTPLAKKEKTFYQFFLPFLKSSSNLKHCEKKDECPSLSHQIYNIVKKKDESPSLSISEISDSKRGGT